MYLKNCIKSRFRTEKDDKIFSKCILFFLINQDLELKKVTKYFQHVFKNLVYCP
jgi:coproporphyrinogen III oxidase-like Fe-S oxidoreductase